LAGQAARCAICFAVDVHRAAHGRHYRARYALPGLPRRGVLPAHLSPFRSLRQRMRGVRHLVERAAGAGPPPGWLVRAGTASRAGLSSLSARERGALELVLFGSLGYAGASRELAVPPRDLAAILRAALRRANSPLGRFPALRAPDAAPGFAG
jgi:hypothetical protein